MSVTTCLMPLPRWHDVSAVAAAGFAVLAAVPVAASEVPARPSMPSSVAELAAAVTRNQATRRPARPCASRPLLMSFPLRPQARHQADAAREPTMPRFQLTQKKL